MPAKIPFSVAKNIKNNKEKRKKKDKKKREKGSDQVRQKENKKISWECAVGRRGSACAI